MTDLITTAQAADRVGCSTSTINLWRNQGYLKGKKTSKGYMFNVKEIDTIVEEYGFKPRKRKRKHGKKDPSKKQTPRRTQSRRSTISVSKAPKQPSIQVNGKASIRVLGNKVVIEVDL